MSGAINLISPTRDTVQPGFPAEWLQICRGGHNVLFEGPRVATAAALDTLRPYLRNSVEWEQLRGGCELHARPSSVLMVGDVASLRHDEQARLLGLLSDDEHPRQVICSTTTSLFPLVARGLFDETLYYRLNVVMVRIRGRD